MPTELISATNDLARAESIPAPDGDGGHPLTVRAARREYANGTGLRGVDLVVRAGELVVLLGPNGAGKTSLIRAICGRVRLTSGAIRVEGRDPVSDSRARTHLGLVPQGVALYEELTARENLELFGRLSGVTATELRAVVSEALDWAGLSSRASSVVKTLSGGMKRRLNLVASTLHRPSLLLLDEPTVGVDPEARERLHALLQDLKRRDVAILLTTHDLEQAEAIADRVAVLDGGRLRANGSVESLVRSFFGSGRELLVRLPEPPAPKHRSVLGRLGLSAGNDPRVWTASLEGAIDSLGQVETGLRRHDIPVLEIRACEPSLRGAYSRILGEVME